MPINKSKRSGGPRTAEGKEVASRNSLKTGAYSQVIVLPGEDPSDFDELQQYFYVDFKVQSAIEISLVNDLAAIAWKKMRLQRLEQEHTINRLKTPIAEHELKQVNFVAPPDALALILNQSVGDEHDIKAFRRYSKRIQEMLKEKPSLQEFKALKDELPDLFDWIMQEAEDLGLHDPSPEILWISKETSYGVEQDLLEKTLEQILDYISPYLWVFDHKKEIEEAKDRIRDERLLSLMRVSESARAFGDLTKSFYRTLTELRKQQDWRRKHSAIDVTPMNPNDDTAAQIEGES